MLRPSAPTADPQVDAALQAAVRELLAPIAALCLARGLGFAVVEDMFKRAFIDAARAAHGSGPGARDISRVATATGLTRREVTRLSQDPGPRTAAVRTTPATQVFTRWMGSRRLQDAAGNPKPLRRNGRAPSFEALAKAVTTDVHPRSLLDELCRLGLVRHDTETDTVHLLHEGFAPTQDQVRMLGFLAGNVGDHLAAAVANVVADAPPHLEQAVFADELSEASLVEVRQLVRAQWKSLLSALVPRLEALIEADREAGRPARQRVRIGLYSYHAPLPDAAGGGDPNDAPEDT